MRRAVSLLLSGLLGCGLIGCGGGPAFDGTTYRQGTVAFRVPPAPAGWRRIDMDAATLAFRDDAHGASILINARCGMRSTDVPLTALRNHLLAGTTDRAYEVEETLPFDEREALHSDLVAKLDGVPMRYCAWVLKKDACVYDFVLVGEPSKAAEGARAFEGFVRGFSTLRGGS